MQCVRNRRGFGFLNLIQNSLILSGVIHEQHKELIPYNWYPTVPLLPLYEVDGAIGTHANADTCLRSRFAAIAQFTDAAVTTTIVDADAVVSAAAPPLPLLRPCRSDAGSWLLPCPPCGTAAASQGSRFERTSGVLMFGAAVGIRGRRRGAARSAFARI